MQGYSLILLISGLEYYIVKADDTRSEPFGKSAEGHHLESNVAEYKKREHIKLLERWCGEIINKSTVLKTDAYEEAFRIDSFMDWLVGKSKFVSCIDISKDIIMRAKVGVPASTLVNASTSRIPFNESTFDIVVSNSTLDHLHSEEVVTSLEELSRIIRKGGLLVLTLDNAHNRPYRLGYFINRKVGRLPYHQERCYFKGEIIPLLTEAGFDVEEIRSIVHLPTPFNLIARIFSPLNKLLHDLPVKAGIAFFSIFGFGGRNIYTGWFLAMKCVKK